MSDQRKHLDAAASHIHKAVDELYQAADIMMASGNSSHENVSAVADALLEKVKLIQDRNHPAQCQRCNR